MFGAEPLSAYISLAAKDQSKLSSVVLRMAKTVDQELADIEFVPPEPTALLRALFSQGVKHLLTLLAAVAGVVEHLLLAVALLGRGDDSAEFLVVTGQEVIFIDVVFTRRERLLIIRAIEIAEEKCVVSDVPDGCALATIIPKLVRADFNGVTQHFDGSHKLPAEYFVPVL